VKTTFKYLTNQANSAVHGMKTVLSPLAMPQEIEYLDKLPKTRSGKIMRRLLHAQEWGEEIGDTSTLEDFSVLAKLREDDES